MNKKNNKYLIICIFEFEKASKRCQGGSYKIYLNIALANSYKWKTYQKTNKFSYGENKWISLLFHLVCSILTTHPNVNNVSENNNRYKL